MSDTAPRLSIVLPCYNEARNLPGLIARYVEVWEDLQAELILVDNGSTDETPAVLTAELSRPGRTFARSVRVEVNQGYGHGIYTGLRAARGETLAYSHADMQCSPADPFRAYRQLQAQQDPAHVLVKGARGRRQLGDEIVTGGMSIFASAVLGQRLTDINAQPKVFPRTLLQQMKNPPAGFEFDVYVLFCARRAGMVTHTIPVTFGDRLHGESKWKFSLFSRYRTIQRVMRYIIQLRVRGET